MIVQDTKPRTHRVRAISSLAPLRGLLAWIDRSQRPKVAALLFLFTAVVYLGTASYDAAQSMDSGAAAFAAWSVAERGTVALNDLVAEAVDPWFVDVDGDVVTNRQPGVIAHGLPLYLAWSLFSDSISFVPAGVTAALVAAAAVSVLFLVLCKVVSRREALFGSLVFGFATATWSVSADALWPHGPGQLWLATALLCVASGKWLLAGGAYLATVLVRPPMAIIPAVQAVLGAMRERRIRPVAALGFAGACAVGLLVAYNTAVFGGPSLLGGYHESFVQMKAGGGISEAGWYVTQLALALASDRGLLVWSPFLIVLGFGLPAAWRAAPGWVREAAVSALVYVLIHYWLNRYSGGDDFWAYRYPLESLVLVAPLLGLSFRQWVAHRPRMTGIFWALVALSVLLHAIGALA